MEGEPQQALLASADYAVLQVDQGAVWAAAPVEGDDPAALSDDMKLAGARRRHETQRAVEAAGDHAEREEVSAADRSAGPPGPVRTGRRPVAGAGLFILGPAARGAQEAGSGNDERRSDGRPHATVAPSGAGAIAGSVSGARIPGVPGARR